MSINRKGAFRTFWTTLDILNSRDTRMEEIQRMLLKTIRKELWVCVRIEFSLAICKSICSKPHVENQDTENQDIENQDIENRDIVKQDIVNHDIERDGRST